MSEIERLIEGTHRVPELHALVPDRVPELRCQLLARRRIGGEEEGVEVALDILRRELQLTMRQTGVTSSLPPAMHTSTRPR